MRKLIWLLLLPFLSTPALANIVRTGVASGGGVVIGAEVDGGTATRVLFVDSSGNIAQDSDISFATDTLTVTKIAATTLTGAMTVQTGTSTAAALGSDLVTNGTFTGNATGWTLGGGGGAPDWAYNSNNVTHASGGGTTALEPTTPLTIAAGTVYAVQLTLSSYASGSITISVGGASTMLGSGATATVGADGTHRFLITASNTANLLITPTNDFAATLDTVSVQSVTIGTPWLTLADASIPIHSYFGPTASRNTYYGQTVGQYNATGGSNNTGFGGRALASNNTGGSNTAIGQAALFSNSNGSNNVAVGSSALIQNISGGSNTSIGVSSFGGGSLLYYNHGTALGHSACGNTRGSFNTCLGSQAGQGVVTADYTIQIGYEAQATASNQLVVGGDATSAGVTIGYFGQGVTKASPTGFAFTTTGGSGSNNAGGGLTIIPGFGTGTAAGGDLRLQRSPSIATGSTLQSATDAYFIRSQMKALTDATATAFVRLSIPQGVAGLTGWTGGTVFYTIIANDGTNYQARRGSVNFACVNEAGTEACTLGTVVNEADGTPTGTLTVTFDTNSGAADTMDIRANATSSLTETTLAMFYSVMLDGPGTLTAQ